MAALWLTIHEPAGTYNDDLPTHWTNHLQALGRGQSALTDSGRVSIIADREARQYK